MNTAEIRPIQEDDWLPQPIAVGRYSNDNPLMGYVLANGQGGNVLHPASEDDDFEAQLLARYTMVKNEYPTVKLSRFHVQMPCWIGDILPTINDYVSVSSPQRLRTTSMTIMLIPQKSIQQPEMGYYFQGNQLITLRERLANRVFQGIVGNLGYFMTKELLTDKHAWSHRNRYPDFPLDVDPAYLGFHWVNDEPSGMRHGAFQGAHPAAVGIGKDGKIDVLTDLSIESYTVVLGERHINVQTVNQTDAIHDDVVLFTPALRTPEIERHIERCENSAGMDNGWHTFAPFIPLADRVNVFIANAGDSGIPIEKVISVWDGRVPLPSFGAVLSFKRSYFRSLFESIERFKQTYLDMRVQIIPHGNVNFDDYVRISGGLVPAVVHGEHLYRAGTVQAVMKRLTGYGNTTSPVAQAGKESKNFDPIIREPAGVVVQTGQHIGWILFDGRHELSIGANVVDVARLLEKMAVDDCLGGESIEQAAFIDGGSAMKVYAAHSHERAVELDLLNRVAPGARNRAGYDVDGLNFYSSLSLPLSRRME